MKNLNSLIKKQERQTNFTQFLANKWNLSYEDAFKKQCKTSYADLKPLLAEFENYKGE